MAGLAGLGGDRVDERTGGQELLRGDNADRHNVPRRRWPLFFALGADLTDDGARQTPRRMAAAYAELLTAQPFRSTTFPNDEGYDELVVARSIPFHSLCMHHLLPFHGVAHIGYLPGERILGLSKFARVVELFARDLQIQERLTVQIANWLQQRLSPKGVGVVLQAEQTTLLTPEQFTRKVRPAAGCAPGYQGCQRRRRARRRSTSSRRTRLVRTRRWSHPA
jgi:GTP cyclohydrolase I